MGPLQPLSEPQAGGVAGPTVGRAGGTWGRIYPPLPLVERKQSLVGQAEARGGERVGLTPERLPDPRLPHQRSLTAVPDPVRSLLCVHTGMTAVMKMAWC